MQSFSHSLLKRRILARYLKCAAKYLKAISAQLSFINIYNFLLQLFATSTTTEKFFSLHHRHKCPFAILFLLSSMCKAIFKLCSVVRVMRVKDSHSFSVLKMIFRGTLGEKSSSAYIKTIPLDNIWRRWQLIHLNVFCKVFQRFVKWAATTLWIRKVALNVIYISFAGTISRVEWKGLKHFLNSEKSIKLRSRKF